MTRVITRRSRKEEKEQERERQLEAAKQDNPEALHDENRSLAIDASASFWIRIIYRIREKSRLVLLSLLSVAILFIGILSYSAWSEFREENSFSILYELLKEPTMSIDEGVPEIALEKLSEHQRKHGHKQAQLRSLAYQVQYLHKAKNYTKAALACEELAKQSQSPELKLYFLLRAASYWEQDSFYQKASEAYGKSLAILDKKPKPKDKPSFLAQILIRQGRAFAYLKQYPEARQSFDRILNMERSASQEIQGEAFLYLSQLPN